MKRQGFTLIELLAVIVVLGIIMLIAITAVTNVINNSKVNSLKDSAMLVAGKIRTEAISFGYTDNYTINCLSGDYGLNPSNYEYCSANVSNVNDATKVYVDLIGKGNFDGISIIGATPDTAPVINNTTYQVLKDVLLAPSNIAGSLTCGSPSPQGGLFLWGSKYMYRGGVSRTGASLGTTNFGNDTVSTATDIANYIKVPWENNATSCSNTYSNNPCWKIMSVNSDGTITIVRDSGLSNQRFDNTYNSAIGAAYGYNDLLENVPTTGHPEEYRQYSYMYNYLYGATGYQNTTLKNYYGLLNSMDICLNKINDYAGVNISGYASTTRVIDTCNVTGKANTIQVNPLMNQYVRLPYAEEYINVSLECTCTTDMQYQCRNQNYMYNRDYFWLLNGYASSSWRVRYVQDNGSAYYYSASDLNGVRPVVTLKSTVLITGGTGTVSDPYIIKG